MSSFSQQNVHITYGSSLITGFAAGSVVEIAYNNPQWSLYVGADGSYIRSQSSDYSAKIKITLNASSSSNAALMAYAQTDRLTRLGALPLIITNLTTTPPDQYTGIAWITKVPDRTYSQDAADMNVEWEFETGRLIAVFGVDLTP